MSPCPTIHRSTDHDLSKRTDLWLCICFPIQSNLKIRRGSLDEVMLGGEVDMFNAPKPVREDFENM